ncbi:hypothetical protein [Synechococcus sp. Cruz CV-v-12]|uniref:hypothetical protein n=1 Tax=Synechococcus sp. Cruz CV-v-12 TaxID=2823728 RepID=UPI0020CCF75F|nr:hypothetical protein [Synechococcus sp. Cruz CV-v-12]
MSIVATIIFVYSRYSPKMIGTLVLILKNRRRWLWLLFLLLPSLFFFALHPKVLAKANSPNQESAVWGSYGVFSLFDPQQKSIPAVLRSELNIDGKLVVLRDGPVYSSILSFISDSGNRDLFKGVPDAELIYAINNGQETRASFERKPQAQSLIQFQKDALINQRENTIVDDSLIQHLKPFSTDSDDAKFTLVERVAYDSEGNRGFLTQFPRLTAVQRYNLKLGSNQSGGATQSEQLPLSDNKWLKKVIEANPDWRGLRRLWKTPPPCARMAV